MNALVLMDAQRRIALLIGRNSKKCSLLRLVSGTLRVEKLAESQVWREFRELAYPLPTAVARFQKHGALHGMTKAAHAALERLSQADEQLPLAFG